jgi:hypothetical protein
VIKYNLKRKRVGSLYLDYLEESVTQMYTVALALGKG